MKILIVSDLHIGEVARSKELCPYPEFADLKNDTELVDTFIKECQKSIKNTGKFDYLLIPGDITNLSNLIEYDYGEKFLEKIIKNLKIPLKKVIFVPGNHDIDWSVLKGIHDVEKKFRSSHKYNTLKDSRHSFSNLTGAELMKEPYIKVWRFSDIVFIGFNSSWHDDSQNENHYGLISVKQLEELRKVLNSLPKNLPRIFLVHHHLLQLKNIIPTWIDLSTMQNGQDLFNLLSEFSINFLIHGHRHVPNFSSFQNGNFNPINLLCAGSFSREIPGDIAGYVTNNFHIIEFDSFDNMKSKGKIFSYAYNSREHWIECRKDKHEIDFINPFGNIEPIQDIYQKVFNLITLNLINKATFYYSDIQNLYPELEYLTIDSKKELIKRITEKFDLGSGNMDEGGIIFVNKKS
tara:strand:- start:25 stop:1242 length:1218 start_codon:yes stop_codon:yes gene_type:complete